MHGQNWEPPGVQGKAGAGGKKGREGEGGRGRRGVGGGIEGRDCLSVWNGQPTIDSSYHISFLMLLFFTIYTGAKLHRHVHGPVHRDDERRAAYSERAQRNTIEDEKGLVKKIKTVIQKESRLKTQLEWRGRMGHILCRHLKKSAIYFPFDLRHYCSLNTCLSCPSSQLTHLVISRPIFPLLIDAFFLIVGAKRVLSPPTFISSGTVKNCP